MLKKIPDLIAEIKEQIACVTAVQAVELRQQHNGLLIDVREPAEYQQKSAEQSVNIPRGLLEMKVLEQYPDEEQAIFIHCASGARAVLAAEQLARIGYKNVWAITCKLDQVCAA